MFGAQTVKRMKLLCEAENCCAGFWINHSLVPPLMGSSFLGLSLRLPRTIVIDWSTPFRSCTAGRWRVHCLLPSGVCLRLIFSFVAFLAVLRVNYYFSWPPPSHYILYTRLGADPQS
jgi:hypothetical protein